MMQVPELKPILFVLPWWTKVYNWFRKWGWVPLGLLLLILSFVVGGFLLKRRQDGGVLDPVSDLRQKIADNNKAIDQETETLRRAHEAEVIKIEREHEEALQNLSQEQENRRQELRQNPKKLAKWLTGLARGANT